METTADTKTSLEPFCPSNALDEDVDTLVERMQRDGYLFLRGLTPREEIEGVRREILLRCQAAGWLCENTDPAEGIAAPQVRWIEGQPEFMAVYDAVLRGERFNALAHSSGLLAVLAGLFGEPPLVHPRNIARIIFPNNSLHTTPSHQDYIHIQGTPETYTAWIPLGDCPMDLGSLVVLAGSHRAGLLPVHSSYGAGGVGIHTDALPYAWVGGDFASGDVILFHSHTVHKALPNRSQDRIRLSVDFRYQPLSHPVDASSLRPHHGRLTWEEIYADWTSEHFKYYWRDLPLRYAGHDPRVQALRSEARGDKQPADAPPSDPLETKA